MITYDTGVRVDELLGPLGQNFGNRVTAHRERTVGNEPRTGPYVYSMRGLSPISLLLFPFLSLAIRLLVIQTSNSNPGSSLR